MQNQKKSSMTINTDNREIVITREFDVPRDMVFRVYTDPKHLPQWWGPRGFTTRVEKMDVKPGGVWRYLQQDADGIEYAFNGVFHEVTPPERLVYTFEYEGIPPGHDMLETVTFEERGGKTIVTAVDSFKTVEDLEGMVQSGMESGVDESFERLTELLRTLS